MTVWNDADYTDRLAHANWMADTAVLMHLNERATGHPARDWLSSWAHRWFVGDDLRVLVLGCGEGWLERSLVEWPFIGHVDAVDFAEEAVARAREAARGKDGIAYGVVDLNRDVLPANEYDVVVAHSVLHHVENLEHAFAQIERTMRPNATLIVSEYVGPNRFQYSDRVVSMINALLRCLPEELRRPYEVRTRPTVAEMIANDPTEAVRSEDLLPLIAQHFDVRERKNVGGTLLQHLLYDIVQNFRFDVPRERSIVQMLCAIEAMLLDSGRIESDFVLLTARKKGSRVRPVARPLPILGEAAHDVEPDPLHRELRVVSSAPRVWRAASLTHAHLRLLRLALLSQQEHRANLFEENRWVSWRERFRARGRDPFEWLLAQAPRDEAVQALLRTAATLARA